MLNAGIAREKSMKNQLFKLDSTDQLSEKLEKLKAYGQALKGKELQLIEKEKQLQQKELQLRLFRKNILLAIKEQMSEGKSYEESVKILEKYRDILQYIAEDVKEDLDEIMG
ncbi:MAG: hypothetical protein K0Q57_332 [Gammaproteobacteria bacterium]|jgi:serine protease inhibitor ecotin|nr:hypothetical protein [Gammaproteobacteria bacterium]